MAALLERPLARALHAADLSIEQFAPQSSVLVFSHPGAEAIFKRMENSPVMKMMRGEGDVAEMALITPPVGMNAFVYSGAVREAGLDRVFRGLVPFVLADRPRHSA